MPLCYTLCSATYSDDFGCLLISFANRLDRGQVGLDLDPKLFNILTIFFERCLLKRLILKNLSADDETCRTTQHAKLQEQYCHKGVAKIKSCADLEGGQGVRTPLEKSQIYI